MEGIRGPGDGLGRLASLAGGAGARTQGVAPLHVVHGAGNQVTWQGGQRGGGKSEKKSQFIAPILPRILAKEKQLLNPHAKLLFTQRQQAEVETVTQTHDSNFDSLSLAVLP